MLIINTVEYDEKELYIDLDVGCGDTKNVRLVELLLRDKGEGGWKIIRQVSALTCVLLPTYNKETVGETLRNASIPGMWNLVQGLKDSWPIRQVSALNVRPDN